MASFRLLGVFTLLAFMVPAAQSQPTTNYSHGSNRSYHGLPIFEDDTRLIYFYLTTSWIPGPDHKGVFRYKINVEPRTRTAEEMQTEKAPPQGWGVPPLIVRLHSCRFTLEIMDEEGFVLQRSLLTLATGVNEEGVESSLNTNDSFPMELAQYRSFLAAKPQASWGIGWHCPGD
jgi:hypothetical protein